MALPTTGSPWVDGALSGAAFVVLLDLALFLLLPIRRSRR